MLRRLAYMSTTVVIPSGITIRTIPTLLSGVAITHYFVEKRIQDALEQIRPGAGFQPSTVDSYGPGRTVSIEREAQTTHNIQAGLDDAVEDENKFDDSEAVRQRGLSPCIRVKQEKEG